MFKNFEHLTNSADTDQTASEEAVWSVFPVCYFDKHFVNYNDEKTF